MGYIQRTTGIELDFTKVVISIWFRVPAASFTAAEANDLEIDKEDRWSNIIPLITFGPQTVGQETPNQTINLGPPSGILDPPDIFGYELGTPTSLNQGPGYIGIKRDGGNAFLDVYIPTGAPAACDKVRWIFDDFTEPEPPNGSWSPVFTDVSETEEDYNDYFGAVSETQILPDTIYHLLISWDLTDGSASVGSDVLSDLDCITESSQMWMALNDVNKIENDLPMIWPGINPEDFDGNRHVSYLTDLYAGQNDTAALGTCSVTTEVSSIPTAPVTVPGLPVIAAYDPINFKVQMGDLQIFTNVSLDTSVELNRRAFITSGLRQASPALAVSLLGKSPEVRFQTVNDWQVGNNRGTAGNFTPTGTISPYEFNFG
jgi:hypothetical protein